MRFVKLLYLNRINAKNAIWCTSDLMSQNRDGAGDTSEFLSSFLIILAQIQPKLKYLLKNYSQIEPKP